MTDFFMQPCGNSIFSRSYSYSAFSQRPAQHPAKTWRDQLLLRGQLLGAGRLDPFSTEYASRIFFLSCALGIDMGQPLMHPVQKEFSWSNDAI